MLRDIPKKYKSDNDIQEIVADYIEKRGTINIGVQGRIRIAF